MSTNESGIAGVEMSQSGFYLISLISKNGRKVLSAKKVHGTVDDMVGDRFIDFVCEILNEENRNL